MQNYRPLAAAPRRNDEGPRRARGVIRDQALATDHVCRQFIL